MIYPIMGVFLRYEQHPDEDLTVIPQRGCVGKRACAFYGSAMRQHATCTELVGCGMVKFRGELVPTIFVNKHDYTVWRLTS